MQSVPITTEVVTKNPAHGEVYTIQHYVIKFLSDMWKSMVKTNCHDITEILLKVALNTINQPTIRQILLPTSRDLASFRIMSPGQHTLVLSTCRTQN